MFATKGRLKVSLLFVGVLAVGVGMYAAFQIDNADAHVPDSCSQYTHKPAGTVMAYDSEYYRSQEAWSSTIRCPACDGPTYVTWVDYKVYAVLISRTQHRANRWEYCHGHGLTYEYVGIQRVQGAVRCAANCGG